MEIFLFWVVLSAAAGWIASAKGRNGVGFFFLSLVVSPLVGLIVACALPAVEPSSEESGRPSHHSPISDDEAAALAGFGGFTIKPKKAKPSGLDEITAAYSGEKRSTTDEIAVTYSGRAR